MSDRDLYDLRAKYTRFRILVIGRANAGKTTLLQRVCNTTEDPCIYDNKKKNLLEPTSARGIHDIHRPFVFKSSPGFIFHDSPGFETGNNEPLQEVLSFIEEKAKSTDVDDQLHAIWFCFVLNNDRPLLPLETAFFETAWAGKVPVIAIFTKFDDLMTQIYDIDQDDVVNRRNAEKVVERKFRKPLYGYAFPPRADVCFEDLHTPETGRHQEQVKVLMERTASSLGDTALKMLLVPVQQNNIEPRIQYAINAVTEDDRACINNLPYAKDVSASISMACLHGTRVALLEQIQVWALNPTGQRALLLHGAAGKGKSAIVHTVAIVLESLNVAVVPFFAFNRSADDRSLSQLIPTWAKQLAESNPQYLRYLHTLLPNQLQSLDILTQLDLMVKGLANILDEMPLIFTIDALDECPTEEADALFSILRELLSSSELPHSVRFLFTFRPEKSITNSFSDLPTLNLSIDNIDGTSTDIHTFVKYQLVKTDLEHMIDDVAKASQMLFQYAAVLCRELKSARRPKLTSVQRDLLRKVRDAPGLPLYATYGAILKLHFDERNAQLMQLFRRVMSWIFLVWPPQPRQVLQAFAAVLLPADEQSVVDEILGWLGSLLSGTMPGDNAPITPLHSSLRDFLLDTAESHAFSIDLGHRSQKEIALACLRIMNTGLEFNICKLPASFILNSQIEDLPQRVKEHISPGLRYACLATAQHLRSALPPSTTISQHLNAALRRLSIKVQENSLDITDELKYFLQQKFLYWLEAHSCMQTQDSPGTMLPLFLEWATSVGDEASITLLLDYIKFEKQFHEGYMLSAPQVYYSCLVLAPQDSIVRQMYSSLLRKIDVVWPPSEPLVICGISSVLAISISLDGTHIVSGSDDNMIREWDVVTGKQVGEDREVLRGLEGSVHSVVFSSDGTHIVSGSNDKMIRVWNLVTGEQVGEALRGHEDWVCSVAFSPDGVCIVSGSNDKTIRVWDVVTGQQVGEALRGHEHQVCSVVFSPDGAHIVSGSGDRTIRMWDVARGQQVGEALRGHEGWVYSVAFSPNGSYIVSGSGDKTIRVWDALKGQQLVALRGHESSVHSVAISPDGLYIVSGSDDKTIRVWDAVMGEQVGKALRGHEDLVHSVVFLPDGTRIVSGSYDQTIRIWQHPLRLGGHKDLVHSVVFSPKGTHIVSESDEKTIRVWDAVGVNTQDRSYAHDSRTNASSAFDIVDSDKSEHFLTTACWIAAEHALQHVRNNTSSISEVFDRRQIQKSKYIVLAGFDNSLIKSGVGYLEQIHVFVLAEVDAKSPLLSELGKLFSPFSSILFTESSSHHLPVYKDDGSVWEFDELVYFTASKFADGGSSAKTPLTIISLVQTTSSADVVTGSSQSGSGSGDSGEGDKKRRLEKGKKRDTGDKDKDDKGHKDDKYPSDEPEDPPGDQGGILSKPVKFSFEITSEILHPKDDGEWKVFQAFTMHGTLIIKMPQLSERSFQFTRLKFDTEPPADITYQQTHVRVVVDSQQRKTNVEDIMPMRTGGSDGQEKKLSSIKSGWIRGMIARLDLGPIPHAAISGSATKIVETTVGSEKMQHNNAITEGSRNGKVWWGFNIDDDNFQKFGINMKEDNLPTARFEYDVLAPSPECMDIAIASYWSMILPNEPKSNWIHKLFKFRSTDNTQTPLYSNLLQIVALRPDLSVLSSLPGQPRSHYNANLKVKVGPGACSPPDIEVECWVKSVDVIPAVVHELSTQSFNLPMIAKLSDNCIVIERWIHLILTYAHQRKLFILCVEDSETAGSDWEKILHNEHINGKVLSDILATMVDRNVAAYEPEQQTSVVLIYWRLPEEWANVLYNWASSSGQLNTILTFNDITDPPLESPLTNIPIPLLRKAIAILGKTGRSQIIAVPDGEGVKFLN